MDEASMPPSAAPARTTRWTVDEHDGLRRLNRTTSRKNRSRPSNSRDNWFRRERQACSVLRTRQPVISTGHGRRRWLERGLRRWPTYPRPATDHDGSRLPCEGVFESTAEVPIASDERGRDLLQPRSRSGRSRAPPRGARGSDARVGTSQRRWIDRRCNFHSGHALPRARHPDDRRRSPGWGQPWLRTCYRADDFTSFETPISFAPRKKNAGGPLPAASS